MQTGSDDLMRTSELPKLPQYLPLLYDLEHHRLLAQLEGHADLVFSARFTASGIVTMGDDGTVWPLQR